MKAKTLDLGLVFVTLAVLTFADVCSALAQGTAFTYQGRLQDGAIPANGSYDFRFGIYDALAGGNAVNGTFTTNMATLVTDGLFTVMLDFGSDVFNGANSWLEIDVRTNGNGGFTTLTPRQPITSTPYAIQAINAATATTANVAKSANSVSAANITGAVQLAQLPGAVVTNDEANVTLGGLTLNDTLHLPGTTSTGIIYAGSDTLIHTFGTNNFFAGSGAGNLKLSGRGNVGVGFNALHENTTGTNNTAVGAGALGVNTIGSYNTANGNQTLAHNTRGNGNTASGWCALLNNTCRIKNTGH
ncbi:MAG: hypothetical protein JWM99_1195 [Verrucomicrobiales bacterium]|nr:hypothetical protein [Verrucomicrobiales bacterium]